jgi:hypothetical protein
MNRHYKMTHNDRVLLQVGYLIMSSPEQLLKNDIELKLTTKSEIDICQVLTKVQRCKSLMFQRSALLAAILLLAVVVLVKVL